jgi:hypothetical protein
VRQSRKTHNDALDHIRQFKESFDKKLSFENLRLSERYIEGEIYALVCFMVPGNCVQQCALFHREKGLRCWKINNPLREGPGREFDNPPERFFYPSSIHGKPHLGDDSCGSRQQTMHVDNVKLVEFPQAVIPSTVRLESVYSLFSLLGHSLCFSDRFGSVFLQTLADREINVNAGFSCQFRNQTVESVAMVNAAMGLRIVNL